MSEQQHCHGADEKSLTVIVNGRPKQISRDVLTFDELVDLALDGPARGPQNIVTITFRGASGSLSEGELDEEQHLKLRDQTVVNVTRTEQS